MRLDRVEGGDSGQTGPGDDPRFTVGRLVTQPRATDNGNGTFPQRHVLSFIRIETDQAEITISGPKIMNTSDTTALSCGEPCIRSKTNPFTQPLACRPTRSPARPPARPGAARAHSLAHPPAGPPARRPAGPLTHSPARSPICPGAARSRSLAHSPAGQCRTARSPAGRPTRSLARPPTARSLAHPPWGRPDRSLAGRPARSFTRPLACRPVRSPARPPTHSLALADGPFPRHPPRAGPVPLTRPLACRPARWPASPLTHSPADGPFPRPSAPGPPGPAHSPTCLPDRSLAGPVPLTHSLARPPTARSLAHPLARRPARSLTRPPRHAESLAHPPRGPGPLTRPLAAVFSCLWRSGMVFCVFRSCSVWLK